MSFLFFYTCKNNSIISAAIAEIFTSKPPQNHAILGIFCITFQKNYHFPPSFQVKIQHTCVFGRIKKQLFPQIAIRRLPARLIGCNQPKRTKTTGGGGIRTHEITVLQTVPLGRLGTPPCLCWREFTPFCHCSQTQFAHQKLSIRLLSVKKSHIFAARPLADQKNVDASRSKLLYYTA